MHHHSRHSRFGRSGWYVVAVAVAATGIGIRGLLDPILDDGLPFSIAVIIGVALSRYSGFRPAAVAVGLGVAASHYLFVKPRQTFAFTEPEQFLSMCIPVGGGLVIAWLMDELKVSRERAKRQARRLLAKQRQHEVELAERQRIEEHLLATKADLRLGQEEFKTLAEKSPVGIFRTDREGACTFVNEYWCRMARMSAEEARGFGWCRAIHPDDVGGLVPKWQECVREGRPYFNEFRMLPPDGEIRAALSVARPVFDQQGNLAHYVGVVIDMSEQKHAYDALARKQSLLRSLIEAQEREKSLLCHEFHDGLIQYAVASLMVLESCRHGGREDMSPDLVESIDNVIRFLTVGIEDGRRVIRGIRTAVLDDIGLEAAIDDLVDQFATCGISCVATVDLGADTLTESLQTTVYRIVQESLSNVRRHSGARGAEVGLVRRGDEMRLTVGDDGCGFDPAAARGRGFGLLGIEERTMLADGDCRIESAPGKGTTISVRLPVSHDAVRPEPAVTPTALA